MSWSDRSRFAKIETEDYPLVLYHQGLHHGQCQCHLCVVVVVDTPRNRRAVLLSPDVAIDPPTLSRDDKARFQLEFWVRDAEQWAGLTDGLTNPRSSQYWICLRLTPTMRLAILLSYASFMNVVLVEMKTTVFFEGKRLARSCQERTAAAGHRFMVDAHF